MVHWEKANDSSCLGPQRSRQGKAETGQGGQGQVLEGRFLSYSLGDVVLLKSSSKGVI